MDNSSSLYRIYIEKKNATIVFFLFLIFPFLTFLYSFLFLDKKWARIILLLFTILYGFNMTAGYDVGLDLYRYLLLLKDIQNIPTSEFFNFLSGQYVILGSKEADIYRSLIAFIVSRFTDNGHVLMAVLAFVYGLLFYHCLNIFFKINSRLNFQTYSLLLCFAVSWGLSSLAFVRFPTASLLFFILCFKIFENPSKKKYWILLSLVLMIHFGLGLAVLLLIFFFLIENNKKVIYTLFIASILIPNLLQLDSLSTYINVFPDSLQNRINLYTNESYIESTIENKEKLSWFIAYIPTMIYIYTYSFIVVFLMNYNKLKIDLMTNRVYLFSILILTAVNFTNEIPELGDRYIKVFLLFFTLFLYKIYTLNYKNIVIKNMINLSLLFFALIITYDFRNILYYTTPSLYIGNVFSVLSDESIMTVWKYLF